MAMKRKPPKPLSRGEKALRAAVRLMPCCACGKPGPSQYSHVTLNANSKGHGMKTAHGVPHCGTTIDGTGCHEQWDQRKGRFAGMSKDMRFELAGVWVRLVMLALTPDDRAQAEAFEAMGLGSIVDRATAFGGIAYGWAWIPTIPATVLS